jgi:hypothetical protein
MSLSIFNSEGLSVLFLIIAMLMMVTIGYVLSYLIPTKQKSVMFPIYSSQAFFIAQSGLEYAIRYASDQGWRGITDSGIYDLTHLNDPGVNQRNLGNGQFTINYTQASDTLTSTGTVTNASPNRVVKVSNFTDFLRLTFASPAPAWTTGTSRARFYIANVRGSNVILTAFSASWTARNNRTISTIYFTGTSSANRRYTGSYVNNSGRVNFNLNGNSQTISPTPPSATTSVYIYWSGNLGTNSNIMITFYTAAGDSYPFDLDPQGNGL